jgi:hypothetical protein
MIETIIEINPNIPDDSLAFPLNKKNNAIII